MASPHRAPLTNERVSCPLHTIFCRYPNSREQLLLIDFFKRAGTVHRQTGYKSSFLCDTLHLDIPRLFYINQETKQKEDVNVMRKFLDVLHSLEIMQPTYLMDQLDRILVRKCNT